MSIGLDGMKVDLHVHSRHSGPVTLPLLGRIARECYAEPVEVYCEALRRGMDAVTLTDHDSIEGGLALARFPRTFLSEEVTCALPGGREVHLGVYDLDEAQHAALTARRRDTEALLAYLAEEKLAVALNHPFAALTGRRRMEDLHLAFGAVTHVETRNGALPASSNAWAGAAAGALGRAEVGGSDAHTLGAVARAWTQVPGARSLEEFLEGLKAGRTLARGGAGSYRRLTAAVADLAASACADNLASIGTPGGAGRALATILAMGALPFLPLATAAVYVDEALFARRYGRPFVDGIESRDVAAYPPLGDAA